MPGCQDRCHCAWLPCQVCVTVSDCHYSLCHFPQFLFLYLAGQYLRARALWPAGGDWPSMATIPFTSPFSSLVFPRTQKCFGLSLWAKSGHSEERRLRNTCWPLGPLLEPSAVPKSGQFYSLLSARHNYTPPSLLQLVKGTGNSKASKPSPLPHGRGPWGVTLAPEGAWNLSCGKKSEEDLEVRTEKKVGSEVVGIGVRGAAWWPFRDKA